MHQLLSRFATILRHILKVFWWLLMLPFTTAQSSAIFLLILGASAAYVGYLQQYIRTDWLDFLDNPIADFYANASAEMISIAITVLIIERANRKQNEEDFKEQLIFEVGGNDPVNTRRAMRLLRHKGWLTDGSLKEANLFRANLQEANLRSVNLQGVDLEEANLRGTYLVGANLQEAILVFTTLQEADLRVANLQEATLRKANLQEADLTVANLQEADLRIANLQEANLSEANLQKANLSEANLQAAELRGANLQGANLRQANLDDAIFEREFLGRKYTAILPNGEKWTPDTDMARFTDPGHPDFWDASKHRDEAYSAAP